MATCSSILAGESHGQRSLEGYSPRGPKELDRIEHPCTHTLGCGLCVKKAERQRIDALELWCWRRLFRVPWTARRSNQSILKITPGCSLGGLMLKLKLQYFGHLMRSWLIGRLWCWEGFGAEGDDRGWDGWMASPTRWTWVWVNSGSWWWTGRPGVLQFMGWPSQTQLSNWTETAVSWPSESFLVFWSFLMSWKVEVLKFHSRSRVYTPLRFNLAFPPKPVSKLLRLQANRYKQALLGPHFQEQSISTFDFIFAGVNMGHVAQERMVQELVDNCHKFRVHILIVVFNFIHYKMEPHWSFTTV